MYGKLGEVDIGSGQYDLLHRCLVAADVEDLRFIAQAAEDYRKELLRRDLERQGKAGPARQRIADEGMATGTGGLEQHRFWIGFEPRGDRGELGGAHASLELGVVQLLDKAAQPVGVAIDAGGGRSSARHLLQAHGRILVAQLNAAPHAGEGRGGGFLSTDRMRVRHMPGPRGYFFSAAMARVAASITSLGARAMPSL